jgi:glutathione S-transferase
LFSADLPPGILDAVRRKLFMRFDYLAEHLAERTFLTGDAFTVADAYCFTILNWAQFVDVDMSPWPALKSYVERVKARPKVQEAMHAEEMDYQGMN